MRKTLILILSLLLIIALPVIAFYSAVILYVGNHGRLIFNEHSAMYFFEIFFFVVGPILLIVLIRKVDSLSHTSVNFFRIISLIISVLLALYVYYNLPNLVQIYAVLSFLILVASILLTVLLFMPLRTFKEN
jgi:hypothetical protein